MSKFLQSSVGESYTIISAVATPKSVPCGLSGRFATEIADKVEPVYIPKAQLEILAQQYRPPQWWYELEDEDLF